MQSLAERIAALPSDLRAQALSKLTPAEADALLYDWRGFLARPEQLMPDGDWAIWLVLAGRGFGKTRTGAEAVREEVSLNRSERIGLIAETAADARDVMVAELMRIFPKSERPVYKSSKRLVEFNNGAVAFTYNATEPDQLRGPQHDFIWCFVADTQVEVLGGAKPIQDIKTGDFVLTRRGYRKVSAAGSRRKPVGKITFANGAELVGTADHPVYTSSGWTRMDQLREGDAACAISVSRGAVPNGTSTAKAEGRITSEQLSAMAAERVRGFIAKCGDALTATYRTASTFTTLMVTRQTTTSATLPQYQSGGIQVCTSHNRPFHGHLGEKSPLLKWPAQIAERLFSERQGGRLIAVLARRREVSVPDRGQSVSACNAGLSSKVEPETFAVSVASTWQPLGEQEVFCLTVDDQPEYFANGILVHNCDELAKWRYARETWDQAQFGLRLGKHPRQIVTTTPRPIELLKSIVAGSEGKVHITRGRTMDNRANLAASFMERIQQRYAGTRLGRQELEAEILGDLPGALWTRSMFDVPEGSKARGRVAALQLPDLVRVVVAVDPSGTSGDEDDGDSIGIIVAGVDEAGHGYVLADRSVKEGPAGWGRAAVEAYHAFGADRIIGEANFGGAMVEAVIRAVDPDVSYRAVKASRGKVLRAEPVAALYEQGRVSHVTGADLKDQDGIGLAEVEDQLCLFSNTGYHGDGSPDRADALVWAITELMVEDDTSPAGVFVNRRRG